MKELGIIKGEYQFSEQDFHTYIHVGGKQICSFIRRKDTKVTGEIMTDALNTVQKCGLLPSELLKQRDELRERCKKLELMIDNGLGWKDMENDITMPHEL